MNKIIKTLLSLTAVSLLTACGNKEIYNFNDFYTAMGVLSENKAVLVRSSKNLKLSGVCTSEVDEANEVFSKNYKTVYKYEIDLEKLQMHVQYTEEFKQDYVDPSKEDVNTTQTSDKYFIYDYKTGFNFYNKDKIDFICINTSNQTLLNDYYADNYYYSNLDTIIEEPTFDDFLRDRFLGEFDSVVSEYALIGIGAWIDHCENLQETVYYNSNSTNLVVNKETYDIDPESNTYKIETDYAMDVLVGYADSYIGNYHIDFKEETKNATVLKFHCSNTMKDIEYMVDSTNKVKASKYVATEEVENKIGAPTFVFPDFSKASII